MALNRWRAARTITVLSSCLLFVKGLEVKAGDEVANGRHSLSRAVKFCILVPGCRVSKLLKVQLIYQN